MSFLYAIQQTPQIINNIGGYIQFDNITINKNFDVYYPKTHFAAKKSGIYSVDINISDNDFSGIGVTLYIAKNDIEIPGSKLVREEYYFPSNVTNTMQIFTQSTGVLVQLQEGDTISCYIQSNDTVCISDSVIRITKENGKANLYAVQSTTQTIDNQNQPNIINYDDVLIINKFKNTDDGSFICNKEGYYTVNVNAIYNVDSVSQIAPHNNINIYAQLNGNTIVGSQITDSKYGINPSIGIQTTVVINKTINNIFMVKMSENDKISVFITVDGTVISLLGSNIRITKNQYEDFIFGVQEDLTPITSSKTTVPFNNIVFNEKIHSNKNHNKFKFSGDGYFSIDANIQFQNWNITPNSYFMYMEKNGKYLDGSKITYSVNVSSMVPINDVCLVEIKAGDVISFINFASNNTLQLSSSCITVKKIA